MGKGGTESGKRNQHLFRIHCMPGTVINPSDMRCHPFYVVMHLCVGEKLSCSVRNVAGSF